MHQPAAYILPCTLHLSPARLGPLHKGGNLSSEKSLEEPRGWIRSQNLLIADPTLLPKRHMGTVTGSGLSGVFLMPTILCAVSAQVVWNPW